MDKLIPDSVVLERIIIDFSSINSSLTTSRILNWFLWFWLVYSGSPDLWLKNVFQWGGHTESLTILLLLVCYWIADALASSHFTQNGIPGFQDKISRSIRHSRIQLPVLLIGTLQSGWLILLQNFQIPLEQTGFLLF